MQCAFTAPARQIQLMSSVLRVALAVFAAGLVVTSAGCGRAIRVRASPGWETSSPFPTPERRSSHACSRQPATPIR